jgi:hypothetical protein
MMKQLSNLTNIFMFAMLCITGSFPVFAFAKEKATVSSSSVRMQPDRPGHSGFCISLDSLGAKVADDIALIQSRYESKRTEDVAALKKRLAGRDKEKNDAWSSWDSKRDHLYVKLERYTKTDQQRAALEEFKVNVDIASRARRKAVDDAVALFHESIDTASSGRQKDINDAIIGFKKKTEETLLVAKADCRQGAVPGNVRAAYVKEMKLAKDDLNATLKVLDKRHDALRTIQDDQQAAVVRATANFRAAIEAAQTTLKQAFSK